MAATSGLIKRLREKDYVRVEACKLDERRKLLFVTDKGRQVRDFMDSSMRALPQMLYRGFSDEELAKRKETMKLKEPKELTGYLKRYAKSVSSADKGAIVE